MTETKLTPWEADTITALDAVYLTAIAKQRREEDSKDRAAGRR